MTLAQEQTLQVIIVPTVVAILSIGAAFQRIKMLEKKIDAHADNAERLIRLETKLDLLLNNKIKSE